MFGQVFIVQDRETAQFLCPAEGDVGLTPWVNEAGRFCSELEAIETAHDHCDAGFFVFKFFTSDKDYH